MPTDLYRPTDNTESAARFVQAIVGWFPDADPPEDWTKQAVQSARRYSDAVLTLAFNGLKREGLRRLPTIPQIEKAIFDANALNNELQRSRAMAARPTQAELKKLSYDLLIAFTGHSRDRIAPIAAKGYGAWLLTTLSRHAWRCAQSGQGMNWPEEADICLEWKGHPNPPEPFAWHFGKILPSYILEVYK